MTTTLDRVRVIIAEQLDGDAKKVIETAHLIVDLGADSLDHVEIMVAVEEEFDIEIDDDRSEAIRTVGDVVKLVDELRAHWSRREPA